MKKYIEYIVVLIFVITAGMMTSCQDYEPFTEHDLVVQTYEKDFVSVFGTPAKNHDWGFVEQPVVDFSQTRAVDANANQFYEHYYNSLNIPGFPDHLHGYFRGTSTMNSDGTYKKIVKKSDANTSDNNWASNNVGNPVGDVTQEEREYVWNWFTTHKRPITTTIQWESFFIQNVDSWNLHYPNDANRLMDNMGYIKSNGDYEHINTFNSTSGDMMYVTQAGTSAWSYWSSRDSKRHNDLYTIQHLVFDIPQTSETCPYGCTNHHYDGWYVAFDYETANSAGESQIVVPADGIFNDWIVKVSPGNLVGYPETLRIMCEDLGQQQSDWDFNDVVFDVSFRKQNGKIFACIALQAAGGTMPITIGTTDPAKEVHKCLGDGSMKPIIHPETFYYYEVEYTGEYSEDNIANAKNIPIYVNNSTEAIYYNIENKTIAQKFACPDYVNWTEENQNILELYPELPTWVQTGKTIRAWGRDQVSDNVVVTPTPVPDNNGTQINTGTETQTPDKDKTEQTETPGTEVTVVPEGTAVSFTNAGVSYSGMTCYAISKEELLKVSASGPYKITVTGKGKAYNDSSVQLVYDLAHPEWGSGQHQVTAFAGTDKSVYGGDKDEAPVQVTTTLTVEQVETLFSDSNFLGGALLVAVSNMSDVKIYVE